MVEVQSGCSDFSNGALPSWLRDTGAKMQNLEQTIRERAYQLWIDGGCQDGKAEAHWLAAQREVLSAALGVFGRVTSAEKPKFHRTTKQHSAGRALGRGEGVAATASR
jgi:hypothetical protein